MCLKPSEMVLMSEENNYTTPYNPRWVINNLALGIGAYDGRPSDQGDRTDALGAFHRPPKKEDGSDDYIHGNGNVFFADGHVEMVNVSRTKELCTPEVVKRERGF